MVLLLEPWYDSTQANPLAQAKRRRILTEGEKRVDAGYIRGYCDCWFCNLRKSDRVDATDRDTGVTASLFHPRSHAWHEHFAWEDYHLVGLTATGRATVAALDLNQPRRIRIRQAEQTFGLFPPGS